MASENSQNRVDLANLNPGELLVNLQATVQALTGKSTEYDGSEAGGILTFENAPSPTSYDDLGLWKPGDKISSIDPVASEKSGKVMSKKGRAEQDPGVYHAIVEVADRYDASTGLEGHGLRVLSRLAIATMTLAAEQAGANLRTTILSDGNEPVIIENDDFTPVGHMYEYDDAVKNLDLSKNEGGKALSEGLNAFISDTDNFDPTTDIAVITSDFLGGEKLDKRGEELKDLDWSNPLFWLNHVMGDRLLTLQLITPAQTQWTNSRSVNIGGRTFKYDLGEKFKVAKEYNAQAIKKQALIAKTLGLTRTFQVSTTDQTPQLSVPEFIFGEPNEDYLSINA